MRDLGGPGALQGLPLANFLCLSYKDNMNTIRWTEKGFRQLRKIKDNQTNRRIYQGAKPGALPGLSERQAAQKSYLRLSAAGG